MKACTASTRLKYSKNEESYRPGYLLDGFLVPAGVAISIASGYLGFLLYYCIVRGLGFVPPLWPMLWKPLTLISVIAALVINRADLQPERRSRMGGGQASMLSVLAHAAWAGSFLIATGLATGAFDQAVRLWLLVWAGLFIVWLCLSRLLPLLGYGRVAARNRRRRENVALIGAHAALSRVATRLSPDTCIKTVVDHSAIAGHALAAALANVVSLARQGAIEWVVLVIENDEATHAVERILDGLKAAPVSVLLCGSAADAVCGTSHCLSIAGVPMRLVADRPLSRGDMFVKLLVDKLGALLLLVLALPLFAAVALAIFAETGGPIIFRQRRTGWCGQLFTVYKFRTMRHAPGQYVRAQTQRDDPRCTRVGAFLRRTSLDELPQLWNVLRGDMSLVGPRPHADFMHARERAECGPVVDYAQRQRVKPGLTGWAQVHGLRGAADTPEKLRRRVEFDRYYIENWSLWLDIKILAQTPWAVFGRENAF